MPKTKAGHGPEDPRDLVERIFWKHDVRGEPRRRILDVVNMLAMAKSQLQGHLSDRRSKIQRLTRELQLARTKNSEDGLVQLYHAGTKLIEQQANEIKGLKTELQRAKDELDRKEKTVAQRSSENDDRVAKMAASKATLGRHLVLPATKGASEESLKKQLRDSRDLASHLENGVKPRDKVIEDLHKRKAELRSSLAGEKTANTDLRSSLARKKATNAELQASLRKTEERCFGYMMTAEEQQRHIDRLAQENARLVDGLGRGFIDHRH